MHRVDYKLQNLIEYLLNVFGLVGGDFNTGLLGVGLDFPLVFAWASRSARESDLVLPGLDFTEDGEDPDFGGLVVEAPSDFEWSSGDLGLFGEPGVIFDWLMFPETRSFGLGGYLDFRPSLGNSCKSNKIKIFFF